MNSKHVLYTKDDFKDLPAEKLENDRTYELVMDGGLGVCKVCGEYEAGLDNVCLPIELATAMASNEDIRMDEFFDRFYVPREKRSGFALSILVSKAMAIFDEVCALQEQQNE